MAVILGIESTAHTFGIGVVKNGKILSNVRDMYITEKGGIIPMEAAEHHERVAQEVYEKSLKEAKINEKDIDAIAFSNAPGLAPCLLKGMKFAKEISKKLKKPLIPVNHCIAHLEIGRITGAKDPVLLYASGANTQIIAYEAGKYRVFGETLDIGVGNFIDNFARYLGLGFPGGPKIEQLALQGKNYIELPYTVKGMDIALSGILTNLKQKIEKMKPSSTSHPTRALILGINNGEFVKSKHSPTQNLHSLKSHDISKNVNVKNKINSDTNLNKIRASGSEQANYTNYTKEDLCFSLQETVFAMLVEVAERALAHTGKKELVLGGGVACNSRLQEMCRIMCEERGAKMFCPPKDLLIDNGSMIAFTGEIMFKAGIKFEGKQIEKLDIKPRQRTDDVNVAWR